LAARQVLITVPLGVLQQPNPPARRRRSQDGIHFEPDVPQRDAIQGLAMGPVVKVVLEFKTAFWPVQNFGFVHAIGQRFPTWWSDERGAVLTAWAGGPRARALAGLELEELQAEALEAAARMFTADPARVGDLFVAAYHHNWTEDPFSRGAYSYTPAGMTHMAARFALPAKNTLFFAGEATDSSGEEGTVHGAIESGRRAARQMIEAMEHDRRAESHAVQKSDS
jgi:monoamine oxidase